MFVSRTGEGDRGGRVGARQVVSRGEPLGKVGAQRGQFTVKGFGKALGRFFPAKGQAFEPFFNGVAFRFRSRRYDEAERNCGVRVWHDGYALRPPGALTQPGKKCLAVDNLACIGGFKSFAERFMKRFG